MFKPGEWEKILTTAKRFSENELGLHLAEAKKRNLSLEDYLISQKIVNEEQLYQAAATFYKLPFVNLKSEVVRKDILLLIPEPIASAHRIIAFDKTDRELKIAALNPADLEIFEFLRKKTGLDLKIYLTTPEAMNETLKSYHKGLKAEFQELTQQQEAPEGKEAGPQLKELAQDLPVIRIVDTLLEYAII